MTDLIPPGITKAGSCCWTFPRSAPFLTSYQLLDEVAGGYRYRKRIRAAVEKDLLRWACVNGRPVFYEVYSGRPVPVFERGLIDAWLDAGGRSWIILELARRSHARVVPFRGRA